MSNSAQVVRLKRLYPHNNPSSNEPSSSLSPTLTTDGNISRDNRDETLQNNNCPVVQSLQKSLSALQCNTVGNTNTKTIDDDAERAIATVIEHVELATRLMCGDNQEDQTYFTKHGRILVIEEVDAYKLENGHFPGYKTNAGELAGLNPAHGKIRRRVHLYVEGKHGVYGANGLRINYHYQIPQSQLKEFLIDAYHNSKLSIKFAGNGGNIGVCNDAGLHEIPPNTDEMGDCVIYTGANCPFPIATCNTVNDGGVAVECKEPSFFAVGGHGSAEISPLVQPLGLEGVCGYLQENVELDDGGIARKQDSSITFGFSPLNCTNCSDPNLYNLPAPFLTSKHEKTCPGFTQEDESVAASCRRTMANMTRLGDGLSSLFNIDKFFNDEARNRVYAHQIHKDNRAEAMVAALSNCFGCHIDNHNGDEKSYRLNLTAFEYVRSEGKTDPTSVDYYARVNIGIYSRRICDTTNKRREGIGRLIDDLETFLSELPESETKYDAGMLRARDGDYRINYLGEDKCEAKCDNDMIVVARRPNINKNSYYMFFVQILAHWINRRKRAGVPVSFPEMVEAVMTAVRWTTSPSQWAFVFNNVTADEGFELKLPKGVTLNESQDGLRKNNGRTLKNMKSHESPFPLAIQYIFASIQLTGGVAGGQYMRFQPHASLTKIDIGREMLSLSQLYKLISDLNIDTNKLKTNYKIVVNDDESFIDWAKSISALSIKFVKDASKNLKSGGVLGFGELISHHFIAIMSIGGWADTAHSLNTIFSKGNGTTKFLLETYDLDVARSHRIIEGVCLAKCVQPHKPYHRVVAENAICKMGQSFADSMPAGISRWWETALLHERAFLINIIRGKAVAINAKGETNPVKSGWGEKQDYYKDPLKKNDLFDLSLLGSSTQSTHWHRPTNNTPFLLSTLLATHEAEACDKQVKKNLKHKEKGTKKRKRPNVQQQRSGGSSRFGIYQHPTKPWAKITQRSKTNKSVMQKLRLRVLEQLIYNRTVKAAGLGELPMSNMPQCLLNNVKNGKEEMERIVREFESVLKLVNDIEDVNEINDESSCNTILASLNEMLSSVQCSQRTSSRLLNRGLQHDGVEKCKNDGRDFNIDDKTDAPENCLDPLNAFFGVYEGGRTLPNAAGCEVLEREHTRRFNISEEIIKFAKTLQNKASDSSAVISYQSVTIHGNKLWICQVKVNDHTYSSCDKVFKSSCKGRTHDSFPIGLYSTPDGNFYETKIHAELAVLMGMMTHGNSKYAGNVENCFLKKHNFFVLLPTDSYAMNVKSNGTEKEALPLCCILRKGKEILAIDCEQLKFMAFLECEKSVTRSQTTESVKSGKRSPVSGDPSYDKCTQFMGPNMSSPVSLHTVRSNRYSMKARRGRSGLLAYLGEAAIGLSFPISRNADEVMLLEDKWIRTTEPRSCSNTIRKDQYWYSPELHHKFRSKVDVDLFKTFIRRCNGDETKALTMFLGNKKGKSERIEPTA